MNNYFIQEKIANLWYEAVFSLSIVGNSQETREYYTMLLLATLDGIPETKIKYQEIFCLPELFKLLEGDYV